MTFLNDIVIFNKPFDEKNIKCKTSWLNLKATKLPKSTNSLHGCNLIILEIILLWLKLTHNPIIPNEIKIILQNE